MWCMKSSLCAQANTDYSRLPAGARGHEQQCENEEASPQAHGHEVSSSNHSPPEGGLPRQAATGIECSASSRARQSYAAAAAATQRQQSTAQQGGSGSSLGRQTGSHLKPSRIPSLPSQLVRPSRWA